MSGLLAELKRRNVIRMAGLYLVGAWLLTQVASTVLPAFDVPGWALRALIIVLALGFLPALIFAWVFELTPEGIKRDAEVEPEESIAPQTARRMDRLIIVLLAIALVYVVFDKFMLAPQRESALVEHAHRAAVDEAAAQHAAAVSPKSIAVLPFTDMSPTHDQEYFSDGMAEELLNALAKVKDLKVAGRTSSFSFKGKNQDLRAIGQTLGVANVLEGSVRKQGDKVRITAQLIRTDNDFHLWSETYDGDLSDVFALQERIARAITEQLKVVLEGGQKANLVPVATTSPEAYALYLQATAIFDRRDTVHYNDGIAALQEAIRLDPRYARAHSRLAAMYVLLPTYTDAAVQPAHEKVMQYAQNATALDPTLAEPYAAVGFSLGKFPGKCIEQREAFDRALELDANDVTTTFWYGLSLIKTGYRARGLALIDRTMTLDPMLPNGLRWRGIMYAYAGDLDRAGQLLKRARALGLPFADRDLADVVFAQGDTAGATRLWLQGARAMFPGLPPDFYDITANGIFGDEDARTHAVAVIETYLATPREHVPGLIPQTLFKLREPARALTVLHTMLTGDTTDTLILLWSPKGRPMRILPEFPAFLRDFGLVELWDKYGDPDDCRKTGNGDYACE